MFTLNGLRNITVISFTLVAVYLGYLMFFPFRTLEPRVQPYKILTPQVHVGETVIYEANYCKYTDAPATVVRNMMSDKSVVIGLPTTSTNLPVGCHIAQAAGTVVPPATPAGRYQVIITLIYHVNPFRDINLKLETEYFEVLPKKENP